MYLPKTDSTNENLHYSQWFSICYSSNMVFQLKRLAETVLVLMTENSTMQTIRSLYYCYAFFNVKS